MAVCATSALFSVLSAAATAATADSSRGSGTGGSGVAHLDDALLAAAAAAAANAINHTKRNIPSSKVFDDLTAELNAYIPPSVSQPSPNITSTSWDQWLSDDDLFVPMLIDTASNDSASDTDDDDDNNNNLVVDPSIDAEENDILAKALGNVTDATTTTTLRLTDNSTPTPSQKSYSRRWLLQQINCPADTEDLTIAEVRHALERSFQDRRGDDELQGALLDLLGFDKLSVIEEIFAHKKEVLEGLSMPDVIDPTFSVPTNGGDGLPPLTPAFFLQQELAALNDKQSTIFGTNEPFGDPNRVVIHTSNIDIRSQADIDRERAARKQQRKRAKTFKQYHEQAVKLAFEMGYDLEQIKATLRSAIQISRNKKELEGLNKRLRLEMGIDSPNGDAIPSIQPSSLPNVYINSVKGNTENNSSVLSAYATKFVLPEGSIRTNTDTSEEIMIPCPPPAVSRKTERLVPITELNSISERAFSGYSSFNRMQSIVYNTAYTSNENILICAPTGAGKTDVAMLTIMNCVEQNLDSKNNVLIDDFKIIYVAPMKALAAEIVRKFSKRLTGSLGIIVRELTGDMQLTRAEIRSTQIIVTTPEKWDVITRKASSDDELVSKVRLLIIDEVHLLDEDRGAVIETIVARTQRHVEITQHLIRIVGLSATLPNYLDVAEFLAVNIYSGLFVFDSGFRPVPLEQHFVGIKGKGQVQKTRMNTELYEKTVALMEKGAQVMVFVHSRRETQTTCDQLRDDANLNGTSAMFSAEYTPGYESALMEMQKHCKNKKLVDMFKAGFGMHNAGMLRSDRTLVEKMFEKGFIRVLCCTATLAWGVNLPAYAVIIKGTQLYDPTKGGFVDLSILDVLQIFGRAGRPQYENEGVAYILTEYEKLHHYVTAITQQKPIESQLQNKLIDILNAEICLNSISNLEDAIRWMSYTYLNVRARKNPLHYGIEPQMLKDDVRLVNWKRGIIIDALRKLHLTQMIVFDEASELITPKDLGRIAANYYISQESIMVYNSLMTPAMEEANVLRLIAKSSEFATMRVRDDEVEDLARLERNAVHPTSVARSTSIKALVSAVKGSRGKNSGGSLVDEDKRDPHARKQGASGSGKMLTSAAETATVEQKVNILLQAYISRCSPDNFALVSDIAYIAQNGARIIRCLFEVALSRNWGGTASILLQLCKSVDRRMWAFEQPLMQFNHHKSIVDKIAAIDLNIEDLREMNTSDLGNLVRHQKFGSHIARCVSQFPLVQIEGKVFPITRSILRVQLSIYPDFKWSNMVHGMSEPMWVWVEDGEHNEILYSEFIMLKVSDNRLDLSFVIPVMRRQETKRKQTKPNEKKKAIKPKQARIDASDSESSIDEEEFGDDYEDDLDVMAPNVTLDDNVTHDDLPNQIYVRVISDRWVGCESVLPISFKQLILPSLDVSPHTDLLNLTPLPVTALKNPVLETICSQRFDYFNPVQTQIFHTLYYTRHNCLVGAPTGSGKTVCAEIAMWASFRDYPKSKVVYIAPLKALVKERVQDWTKRLAALMDVKLVELTGDVAPDLETIQAADLIITTPEKWDGVSRSWKTRKYVKDVSLVIIDEIHLLGSERGPTLEVIVSRMNLISQTTNNHIRIVGLSTALANAHDLANWLEIGEVGLFNFRHSVRPVPLEIYIDGFPGKHYCPRMGTMNKPAFLAIKTHSPTQPVIVFVSSRRQTRLTAQGLIALCALEEEPRRFLKVRDDEELAGILSQIKDQALQDAIGFGIGLHHAGLIESDRKIVESLFLDGKIQILVATSTLAWGVNYPAHLVIVKGTEFYDADSKSYVDFPITDVLQMMGRAGRPQFDTSGVARIFVQDIKKSFYKKFLHEPFPVESSLHLYLEEHINAEIVGGSINDFDTARYWLSWTYLARRVRKNPSFYGLDGGSEEDFHKFFDYEIGLAFRRLHRAYCISAFTRNRDVILGEDERTNDENALFEVKATPFGEIASFYYLQYQTIGRLLTGLDYIVQERKKIIYNEDGEQEAEALNYEGLTFANAGPDGEIDVWDKTPTKEVSASKGNRSSNIGSTKRTQARGLQGTLPTSCLLIPTDDNPFGGLPALIFAWSHCAEYARLPVRHNEDLTNKEIAIQLGSGLLSMTTNHFKFANALTAMSSGVKIIPISAKYDEQDNGDGNNGNHNARKGPPASDDLEMRDSVSSEPDYLSPYTKAFLLLETHLAKRTGELFTTSDYHTDLQSVLDQAERVLQAMMDIVVELAIGDKIPSSLRQMRGLSYTGVDNGNISVLFGLILLLQGVRCACWPLAMVVPGGTNSSGTDYQRQVYPELRGWETISGYQRILRAASNEDRLARNDSARSSMSILERSDAIQKAAQRNVSLRSVARIVAYQQRQSRKNTGSQGQDSIDKRLAKELSIAPEYMLRAASAATHVTNVASVAVSVEGTRESARGGEEITVGVVSTQVKVRVRCLGNVMGSVRRYGRVSSGTALSVVVVVIAMEDDGTMNDELCNVETGLRALVQRVEGPRGVRLCGMRRRVVSGIDTVVDVAIGGRVAGKSVLAAAVLPDGAVGVDSVAWVRVI